MARRDYFWRDADNGNHSRRCAVLIVWSTIGQKDRHFRNKDTHFRNWESRFPVAVDSTHDQQRRNAGLSVIII
jgi:hypothetical protein